MPRKIDPKNKIKTGTGLAGNDSIEANAFPDTDPNMAVGVGLEAHLNDPVDAHPASAISYENEPIYFGDDVEEVLDELGGLVPPKPPTIGKWKTYMDFFGITDWGRLKLTDDNLSDSYFVFRGNDPRYIYPYYHQTPKIWADLPPEPRGADISSDEMFNVFDPNYKGGGGSFSWAGGFTSNRKIVETHNIIKSGDHHDDVVLSGSVFPADRGTMAIFFLKANGGIGDIECLSALNLGQGIEDGCDGETGGIWNYGVNGDPYQYPSAASGQFNLRELHTGCVDTQKFSIISVVPAQNLPHSVQISYNIMGDIPLAISGDTIYIANSDAVPDINGYHEIVEIGPGGLIIDIGTPLVTNGTNVGTWAIPLSPSDFAPHNADNSAGQVREGYTILGGSTDSVAPTKGVDGRNDNNFFRYRLPYLEDYSSLQWSPPTSQTALRYFGKPSISLDPNTPLTLAGNYSNFNKDYWTFQVARYRHKVTLPNNGSTQDYVGSLFILHFKKEEYFEELLLNGNVPSDDQLYSSNIVDWGDIASDDNIFHQDQAVVTPSSSYNILKSRIFRDEDGNSVTFNFAPYVLQRTPDTTISVSGIKYFRTNENDPAPLSLYKVGFELSDMFKGTWRMGERTEVTRAFRMSAMSHFYTGLFSRRIGSFSGKGRNRSNRIEISYSEFDEGYTLLNAPLLTDKATWTCGEIVLKSQEDEPVFSSDAKPIIHIRHPVDHHEAEFYMENDTMKEDSNKAILVMSSSGKIFGDGNQPQTNQFHDEIYDTQERFLTEDYRWIYDLGKSDGTAPVPFISTEELDRIIGAGLPTVGYIPIPVRVWDDPNWKGASFKYNSKHLSSIAGTPEAQVAGLPFRNPHFVDGVTDPHPSRGILLYPQTDYTVGHRPSAVDGDLTVSTQYDYSNETEEKIYIRAFDVAFSRSNNPVPEAIGSSFCKLRIDGLALGDFAWGGGAEFGGDGIAILVKIAGLTTWLDIGRKDGSGPSKQDAFQDGAGCLVVDPTETFNKYDHQTGIIYSEVLLHMGSATFADNGSGYAPLLVKVILKDNNVAKDLNFRQSSQFNFAQGVIKTDRGLVGISVVRPPTSN